MSLDAIPIHVVPPGEPGLTGNAPPLLRELLEMVRRLLATGEASAIDPRGVLQPLQTCLKLRAVAPHRREQRVYQAGMFLVRRHASCRVR